MSPDASKAKIPRHIMAAMLRRNPTFQGKTLLDLAQFLAAKYRADPSKLGFANVEELDEALRIDKSGKKAEVGNAH